MFALHMSAFGGKADMAPACPLNILDLGVEERHANGHARSSRYSLKGLAVSVQTTERTDWYAVGVSDTSGAHDLVVEYCKAHLGHAVRLERPLTDREIDALQLQKGEVKLFEHSA